MSTIRSFSFAFLVTFVLAGSGRSDGLSVPSLVAGYSEGASSIQTLYIDYSETYPGPDNKVLARKCVFARDGLKWHFATRPITDDSAPVEEAVECSDGKRAFLYYLRAGASGKVDFGTIQITESRQEPMITPEYTIGLKVPELARFPGANGSLVNVLNSGLSTVKSDLSFGSGGLVFPVTVDHGDFRAEYKISVNIDSDHGFLPALYQVEFSDKMKEDTPSHRDWSLRWETSEFQRFPDGMSGGDRWFPSVARFTQVTGRSDDGKSDVLENVFSIQSVLVNKPLDPSLFNPQIP